MRRGGLVRGVSDKENGRRNEGPYEGEMRHHTLQIAYTETDKNGIPYDKDISHEFIIAFPTATHAMNDADTDRK